MKNILIAAFKHETNTSAKGLTGIEEFRGRFFLEADEVFPYFKGTRSEIGGFLDILADEQDFKLIPSIACSAVPSGPVAKEVVDAVYKDLKRIKDTGEKIDGILLSLHGAMVTEISEDGEGEYLEYLRSLFGDDVPVLATLDLHANITEKMIQHADGLFNYDTYPHVDAYERGLEAAEVMRDALKGKVKPVLACCKLPMLMQFMPTHFESVKKFVDMAHDYEKQAGVISVSIAHGFFCADIYESGTAVVAVTDGDMGLAQKIASDMGMKIWQDRDKIRHYFVTVDEAIDGALAMEGGPVVFSDGWDNPGAGSPGDGTHIMRRLLERGVENACVSFIYDPETVKEAQKVGVGKTFKCRLGGKLRPELLGEPIEAEAYVKLLSDGKFAIKGPMAQLGGHASIRDSAVLVINGLEVLVGSNRLQPTDRNILNAHGIDPLDKKIVLVKSANHFRAHYEPVAKHIYDVKVGGAAPQEPYPENFTKCKRPIYPFDEVEFHV